MKRVVANSAGAAFSWTLKPSARLSFLGPVFADGGLGLRGDVWRLLPCLLMRVMEILPSFNKLEIIDKKGLICNFKFLARAES